MSQGSPRQPESVNPFLAPPLIVRRAQARVGGARQWAVFITSVA